MVYDQTLAARVSEILKERENITEMKMFGGVGYLLNGNMACGVNQDYLIIRVGLDRYQAALNHPDSKVFDMTGRPMTGWVAVLPAGISTRADLEYWVSQGVEFAETLPPK